METEKLGRYLSKSLAVAAAATDTIIFTLPSWAYEITGVAIKALDSATSRTLLASGISINSIKMGSEDLLFGDAVDHSFFAVDGGAFVKEVTPIRVEKSKEIKIGLTNNAAATHIIQALLRVRVKYEDYKGQG